MIEIAASTDFIDLPGGEYKGMWSGNYIHIFIPANSSVNFKVDKCINPEKPVGIVVNNGKAYVYDITDL